MLRFAWLYLATALVFFPLDMLWLRVVAKDFYFSRLGPIMLEQPRLGAAAVFYLVYVAGVVWLATLPNLAAGLASVALTGAVLGLVAYGTYDATNYATLKSFPASLALVDVTWGTVLTAVSAAGGAWIATRWFGVQLA